jgi:hypothetical protein
VKYKDYASYAYIAGILDGEGCIHIDKKNPRKGSINPGYVLRIFVNMCDGRALDFLVGFAGGRISKLYDRRGNRNICYHWSTECGKAAELLKKCLPFLRTKREQAELAIRFRTRQERYIKERNNKCNENGSKPYDKHIIDFYEECKIKLQDLKKDLRPPKSAAETKRTDTEMVK